MIILKQTKVPNLGSQRRKNLRNQMDRNEEMWESVKLEFISLIINNRQIKVQGLSM